MEKKIITELQTKRVRWDITGRCNLACLHCYIPKKQVVESTLSDVFEILRILYSNGLREVNLSGREPTIRTDLPRIIEWCCTHDVTVNMTTNGTLLDKRKLLKIVTGLRMLVYSLDGPTPISHEMIRGKGTFVKTIKSITECRKLRDQNHLALQIGVSCTLQKLNSCDISMMIDLCHSLDINFLVINPVSLCGSALPTRTILHLDPEEIIGAWEAISREYSRIRPNYELYLGTYPMEAKLLNLKHKLDLPTIQNGCSAGKTLYIDPMGEAYPCYMLPPMATAMPKLKRYLRPWRVLNEPFSNATHIFRRFISFARTHTQENSPYCANCPDIKTCRRCPLITLFNPEVTKRCQIAMTQLMSMKVDLKDVMIPAVKRNVMCKIANNYLLVSCSKGNYSVEKKFEITEVVRYIWILIDGTRSIKDIKSALIKKFSYISLADIDLQLSKFVDYFWKEGLVGFKDDTT